MITGRWVALVLVHLAATWTMVGILWMVHVVHYPLFGLVGERYAEFQSEHMRRISLLLAVPWATEGLTALGLVALAPTGRLRAAAVVGLILMALVVGLTAFGAAPVHGRLLDGYDAELHRRLMAFDLVRTIGWTVRGALAGLILWWSVSPAPT